MRALKRKYTMSEFKITGTIEKILEAKSGEKKDGSGTWINQDFIVKTKDEYNNLYCFNVFGQEKADNLTKYNKVGDEVEVAFNVNCREYEGRYFTNLSSWRISKVEQEAPTESTPPPY